MGNQYVIGLDQIGRHDLKKAGGKGANLGELIKIGIPVPEGFIVTTASYNRLIQEYDLANKILELTEKTDVENPSSLLKASREIKKTILSHRIPEDIRTNVSKAYESLSRFGEVKRLQREKNSVLVSVRSSATAEDLPTASFAGQQASFLNVKGERSLFKSIRKCWASLYEPRAIFYRRLHNISKVSIAVIVQKMINSEKSGIMFTIDPTSGENVIIIEAIWGLGEGIVGGEVSPDMYKVSKDDRPIGTIIESQISNKTKMKLLDQVSDRTIELNVPKNKSNAQVLTREEILDLSKYGVMLEHHYENDPQDIEFAIENNKIVILQTRPVTSKIKERPRLGETKSRQLLKGTGASPGVATGKVRIILGKRGITKIENGDIIVTTMTSPDLVPSMNKCSAIITDLGGKTCHAAIVSREMGIPAVVGTQDGTTKLKERQQITVDAYNGIVYDGKINLDTGLTQHKRNIGTGKLELKSNPKTSTKVKVNLAFSQRLEEIASKVDGVGLLRIEHMIAQAGIHPAKLIIEGNKEDYIKILTSGIRPIAKAFKQKPVWIRTLDARSDEFRNLEGGENEPQEANPMLGWHGIRRSLDEPELLRAEFEAIKKLYDEGFENLEVMLPFVVSIDEVLRAKEIAKETGMSDKVKVGVMIETPASVMIIEELCKEARIAFASFGTNDLVQLTLGVDRNNERLSNISSVLHPAILRSMKMVIDTCNQFGVETSICGESGSNPNIAKILVTYGIKSISCNIDAIDITRRAIYEEEKGRATKVKTIFKSCVNPLFYIQ
ncbi:MAG TPA: phosphoenolpyruvate synthase [Nitrososphaeraceae archaeon]|nr:phosphoenolpyruvate synthase [Nitrososphaeraceae archaeon]